MHWVHTAKKVAANGLPVPVDNTHLQVEVTMN